MAEGQHAVRAGKSIRVPAWTCLQVVESIPVQKWNSPHSTGRESPLRQMRLGHQMTADNF